MDTKKVVLGVLASFAAGAAIGVLFAPDKGSNTRKSISRKGEELADELNGRLNDKFDELADIILGKVRSARKPESAAAEKNAGSEA